MKHGNMYEFYTLGINFTFNVENPFININSLRYVLIDSDIYINIFKFLVNININIFLILLITKSIFLAVT